MAATLSAHQRSLVRERITTPLMRNGVVPTSPKWALREKSRTKAMPRMVNGCHIELERSEKRREGYHDG